jgi:alpha-ketoglutarate-dependent 2,4-dichlorophenoxyacetate dioxygenase
VEIKAIVPDFVGQVTGVVLPRDLSAALGQEVLRGLDDYPVLIFRDQQVTDADQLAFAALLGRVRAVGGQPYIGTSGNVDDDGRLISSDDARQRTAIASRLWHTDVPYKRIPDRYTVLVSQVLPAAGGNTQFCDTYASWAGLPAGRQAGLLDLVAVHDRATQHARIGFQTTDEERRADPPAPHPLVLTNPRTGRRSLYLASDISGVQGRPDDEGSALVEDLMAHATAPRYVHEVEWQGPGTLVVWDNRATMHRGMPYLDSSQPRVLRRCAVVSPAAV